MSISRVAAALGGLALLLSGGAAGAQSAPPAGPALVGRVAAAENGSISGTVLDERGHPVGGALISAIGATRAFAVADKNGQFELRALSAGAYLVRAHLAGFAASPGTMVDVRPQGRTSSAITLRHAAGNTAGTTSGAKPVVLTAGVGLPEPIEQPAPGAKEDNNPPSDQPADDDHSELAWRLRHLRRGVLQDVTLPGSLAAGDPSDSSKPFTSNFGSPSRVATNLFAGAPLSGQLNFLTTSSFDSPQQLFGSDTLARNVAYMSVGAPQGSTVDWTVSGALSQADISAWVIAGTYSTRGPARHHYDVGLSYATQRYDGGNPAALRDVTDGSRNAGAVYGFDTFTISPAIAVTYGSRYARYDYLEDKGLVSPRLSLTLSAGDHLRLNAVASRRSIAPGAEEFLPPGDPGIWLPPQRTFSSIVQGRPLEAEETTHFAVDVERDLGTMSAVSIRAFSQEVADQLVTMFGDLPGMPSASVGHYFVGNVGGLEARGVAASFRTAVANRVQGSIEYSMTRAHWASADSLPSPSVSAMAFRADRIHDLATTVVTNVPETSTHVVVLYRISALSGRRLDDRPLDSRFDVQVRQSLPFMDFSTARWEMLVGIRNFFRETAADQSVFDELMVVRPPKRLVGGLTMRF